MSRGFSLNKSIENLNGSKEIRVGDVLRITLEIGLFDPDKTRQQDSYQYLALEDRVPAGIVPMNADLKTEGVTEEQSSSSFSAEGNQFFPNYTEFRDNGVRVFKDTAWNGLYRYSYLARAVMEGEFWMVGSRISLMYDPELYGRTQGSVVKILPSTY
ncbi:MAG: alpha-2-macroglobulin [Thermodesulfobacteriota bacterium]|nr:alpha-2-macroglobulin [Thermodesulfobacteriota bacterium]